MENDFEYNIIHPDPLLADFVERFWMIQNHSGQDKEIVVIPDGRIDVFFTYSAIDSFQTLLLGIETEASTHTFSNATVIFGISFKLLAVEYVLNTSVSELVNNIQVVPADFFEMTSEDLNKFDDFCSKAETKIFALIKSNVDARKQKLFELIYETNGSMSVKQLSECVLWSSRQINRYFNQTFGIALKSYCNILRFKASFPQIKDGKFYPEQNFSDQAHFTREVKKFSGVQPKELSKNKNDRFIQFSTLPKK